jgi:short-subunit dehydrogenase
VALVTGASRGFGRAFAVELAAAGAAVCLMARTREGLEQTASMIGEAGGRAICFTADVTDDDAAGRIVATTEEQLGPLDLLVNNAGSATIGHLAVTPLDEWWRTVEVNLRGPVVWTMAVLPGMLDRGRGRIINVSSPGGFTPLPFYTSYCASKAALTQLTASLATEVSSSGVMVHAFGPEGPTDLSRATYENDVMPAELRARFRAYFTGDSEGMRRRSIELFRFVATGGADHLVGEYVGSRDGKIETCEDVAARRPGSVH